MSSDHINWLRVKFRRLLRRGQQEAELDTEMQFHLDQLTDEYRGSGLSEPDARLAARRDFGATDAYREETRDTWCPPALTDLWRSIQFAIRSLARNPGFTFVAIITLALGIGANTSMFSVVNGIVMKPLPDESPDQLDRIYRSTASAPPGPVSAADFAPVKDELPSYGEVATYTHGDMSLAEPGHPPEVARALRVSANFFATFGLQPYLGRDFQPREALEGNLRVVIISHRFWLNRFGGRQNTGALDPHQRRAP